MLVGGTGLVALFFLKGFSDTTRVITLSGSRFPSLCPEMHPSQPEPWIWWPSASWQTSHSPRDWTRSFLKSFVSSFEARDQPKRTLPVCFFVSVFRSLSLLFQIKFQSCVVDSTLQPEPRIEGAPVWVKDAAVAMWTKMLWKQVAILIDRDVDGSVIS